MKRDKIVKAGAGGVGALLVALSVITGSLGSNWYDLLDDKCTDSNYLQSKNAISQSDVNNRLWSRYYKNGEMSPSYFQ